MTESADARLSAIDLMSTAELAAVMNDEDALVPMGVRSALPQIVDAIDAIVERVSQGGRLIYIGAGTPGRIGVLDASEWGPTFGTKPGEVVAVVAGGKEAIWSAAEGAEDDEAAGISEITCLDLSPLDAVVGITSSGRTPFVVAALNRCRELGVLTVGLTCNVHAQLSSLVDHPIEVVVGPEVLAGSTRLKAGTAQKLVLNMISTVVNVRLGKTYGNLMVDLSVSNSKLRSRAVSIVQDVTHATREESDRALVSTNYRVKAAIVVLQLGLSPADAERLLEMNGGRLRQVLESQ